MRDEIPRTYTNGEVTVVWKPNMHSFGDMLPRFAKGAEMPKPSAEVSYE